MDKVEVRIIKAGAKKFVPGTTIVLPSAEAARLIKKGIAVPSGTFKRYGIH